MENTILAVIVISLLLMTCCGLYMADKEERARNDRMVTLRLKEKLTHSEEKELALLELQREDDVMYKSQSGQHAIASSIAIHGVGNYYRGRYQ